MPGSGEPQMCVLCRQRPVEPQWRPFCSERCKVMDLARWADGKYSVPDETAVTVPEPGSRDEESDS